MKQNSHRRSSSSHRNRHGRVPFVIKILLVIVALIALLYLYLLVTR